MPLTLYVLRKTIAPAVTVKLPLEWIGCIGYAISNGAFAVAPDELTYSTWWFDCAGVGVVSLSLIACAELLNASLSLAKKAGPVYRYQPAKSDQGVENVLNN